MKATPVKCSCGWRGRRLTLAARDLECCEGTNCACPPYGRCKCGRMVHSVATLKQWAATDRAAALAEAPNA